MQKETLKTPLERVAEAPLSTIEQKMHGKPLVVIYPRHRRRNAFVAMFLQTYRDNVVYYGLNADDNTLTTWLDHMARSDLMPAPLAQTRAALADRGTPEDLAAAFGADLFMLRSDPHFLLLDTFDRLELDDDAARFFRALPEHMPGHAQVVISARLLGLQPWNDLVLAGQAAVVGNEEAMDGGIYGDDPALGQLEVHALAGGHVYIDGRPVTSWDGSLPRHLFYYFVDHPMVTRDEIFSIFWPKMAVKEATNVFHVTKRKISERLGHELTNYSSGFYIHSPKLHIHYDARLFEESVDEAIENEIDAPHLYYRAIQLYRSDFLPYISMPWVEERRAALQQKYAQALINLGRYYLGINDLDVALGYLMRAISVKPDWEDVHQDVMLIYSQQGRKQDALEQYHRLEETLQTMFGIAPTRDTQHLYQMISAQ